MCLIFCKKKFFPSVVPFFDVGADPASWPRLLLVVSRLVTATQCTGYWLDWPIPNVRIWMKKSASSTSTKSSASHQQDSCSLLGKVSLVEKMTKGQHLGILLGIVVLS
jgi:hypothetical protein